MLAHYHGQTWNAREPAQAMGVNYRAGALFGVECKRTDSSRLTPSMRIASSDLGLRGISVIYPGTKRCPMIGTAGKRQLFFMVDSPRGPDNGYDARIPHGGAVAPDALREPTLTAGCGGIEVLSAVTRLGAHAVGFYPGKINHFKAFAVRLVRRYPLSVHAAAVHPT